MELAVSLRACWRTSSCCRRVGSHSRASSCFTSRRRCTRLRITCTSCVCHVEATGLGHSVKVTSSCFASRCCCSRLRITCISCICHVDATERGPRYSCLCANHHRPHLLPPLHQAPKHLHKLNLPWHCQLRPASDLHQPSSAMVK